MRSDREILEEAIQADFDDLTAHAALADLLIDQGDPRGEFIRVQLALENESLPGQERLQLQKQERKLLEKHEEEWLGPLADRFLIGSDLPEWQRSEAFNLRPHRWHRGHVTELHFFTFSIGDARSLRQCEAELRNLRALHCENDFDSRNEEAVEGPDTPPYEFDRLRGGLHYLHGSRLLSQLRRFQLGRTEEENYESFSGFNSEAAGENISPLIAQMDNLRDLRLFANRVDLSNIVRLHLPELRSLLVYHVDETFSPGAADQYDLNALARNESMRNLVSLALHPGHPEDLTAPLRSNHLFKIVTSPNLRNLKSLRFRMSDVGDEGCRMLVRLGMLNRLRRLDLRHGMITDEGARVLAGCPELRNLESLDVSRNLLTEAGLELLRNTGVNLESDYQGDPADEFREHLFQGDIE